jgi:hypothetical protein
MDQAVNSTMESMLTAKQLAVRSSSPYVYEFTDGSNVQHVYPLNGSKPGQLITLPDGIWLKSDSLNTSGSNRMIFREDGSTEGLMLLVASETQAQRIQVTRRLGIPQRLTDK